MFERFIRINQRIRKIKKIAARKIVKIKDLEIKIGKN